MADMEYIERWTKAYVASTNLKRIRTKMPSIEHEINKMVRASWRMTANEINKVATRLSDRISREGGAARDVLQHKLRERIVDAAALSTSTT